MHPSVIVDDYEEQAEYKQSGTQQATSSFLLRRSEPEKLNVLELPDFLSNEMCDLMLPCS